MTSQSINSIVTNALEAYDEDHPNAIVAWVKNRRNSREAFRMALKMHTMAVFQVVSVVSNRLSYRSPEHKKAYARLDAAEAIIAAIASDLPVSDRGELQKSAIFSCKMAAD